MPPFEVMLTMLLHHVLPALGVSATVTAAVSFACGVKHSPLAAALGLSTGAGLVLWLNHTWTLVPGDSPWNWLPWLALAALWIGRWARFLDVHSRGLLRAATAVAVAWITIPAETRQEHAWLAPAFAALVFVQWTLLERVADEQTDGSVPFCLALIFLVAGFVLIHASIARLMDVSVALAAALVGVAGVGWWRRLDTGGVVPAVAVMLPGLLLTGKFQTFDEEIPWYGYALPALTPLLLAEALPIHHWPRLARFALMLAAILIPLGVAVHLALRAGPLVFE